MYYYTIHIILYILIEMRAVTPFYIRSIPFHHTLLNNQVFMAQFMKEHISNLYSLKYNYNFEIYITYMDYNIYNNIKLNNIVLETELFSIGNENRGNRENNESCEIKTIFDMYSPENNDYFGFLNVSYV